MTVLVRRECWRRDRGAVRCHESEHRLNGGLLPWGNFAEVGRARSRNPHERGDHRGQREYVRQAHLGQIEPGLLEQPRGLPVHPAATGKVRPCGSHRTLNPPDEGPRTCPDVLEDVEGAGGSEHSTDLRQGRPRVLDRAEHVGHEHGVDRGIRERNPLSRCIHDLDRNASQVRLVMENLQGARQTFKPLNIPCGRSLEKSDILVYPNPNPGSFVIDLRQTRNETFEVNVLNTVGQQVYGKLHNASRHSKIQMDLRGLPSGLYQIVITSETSESPTQILKVTKW